MRLPVELLAVRHGALATLNPDGSPWVVPVHIFADDEAMYWWSREDTAHSQNIAADDRVSLTVWLSRDGAKPLALYMAGRAQQVVPVDHDKIKQLVIQKSGSFPPIFDGAVAYRLPFEGYEEQKSTADRWYFYS